MQAALSPLFGRLSDVLERKYLAAGPPLVAFAGAAISARAESMEMLVGGGILIGATLSTISIVQAIPSEILPLKYRPIAQGLCGIAGTIGGLYVSPYPPRLLPFPANAHVCLKGRTPRRRRGNRHEPEWLALDLLDPSRPPRRHILGLPPLLLAPKEQGVSQDDAERVHLDLRPRGLGAIYARRGADFAWAKLGGRSVPVGGRACCGAAYYWACDACSVWPLRLV